VEVADNIIEDNNCNQQNCIHMQVYSYSNGWQLGNITRNTIQRNRGPNIVYYADIYGTPQVYGNIFRDNNVTDTNSGGTITFPNSITIQYNLFENPNILYQVRILASWNTPPKDVKYNWWGSSNEWDVAMSIWDFFYDHTRARGDYIPYLVEPNINGNISLNYTELNFINFNSLRGIMNENYTLPSDETFNLTGTLFIPTGIQLVIESGVTIYCHPSSGKIILDQLLIFAYYFMSFMKPLLWKENWL
jgi:hypothetical protein